VLSDVEIDPSNPDIIYASMWEVREGPWEDGNEFNGPAADYSNPPMVETLAPVNQGLPKDLSQIYVAIAPSDSHRLYATVGAASGSLAFYRSDDGRRKLGASPPMILVPPAASEAAILPFPEWIPKMQTWSTARAR